MNKTIPVTLPDWMWGRLATIAKQRGTEVADLIAVSIVSLLRDDPHRLAELQMELTAARNGGYQPPRSERARTRSNT
jgi:hypothetical protein